MKINKFAVRALALLAGAIGCVAFAGFSGEGAASAAVQCSVSGGHQVERIVGASGCGAKAGPGSRATAEDLSNGGTAIAVSDNGGTAHSYNLQPGSSALAGANSRGTAYSFTTGPKALSIAQARRGGTAVSIGGWGGQAYAGPDGAQCSGGFAAAVDTTTGKACLHSGSIDFRN
ncbi:DUF6764 family protein [Gordonia paraffinivorans]|uniref:Secreted protein n=1 Tax=Gordonia paraffinivorans TaxID=175628 RepID=A0ABD7V5E8_9ACTN|nr:DUF6764 family protein [Gordonia paraffinivorans]MBY4573810.1 hypothetical protein [Gordonia paraffinivorans]MCD2145360.1 hypothetical protein [Gordonia paraffinivorans]VFA89499.1 Uncharacterised protein [Gordonia paraffinivorans]